MIILSNIKTVNIKLLVDRDTKVMRLDGSMRVGEGGVMMMVGEERADIDFLAVAEQ